jgi:CheY-like chemotaxis protein
MQPVFHRPRVLIVDDEPDIQTVLGLALTHDGFDVLHAANAREAIELYAANGTIDIVLMDVNLPDIDGPSALAILRELDPDVLCCFITGDSLHFCDQSLLDEGVFILQKPFVTTEVSQIVHHLLDCKASVQSV